MKVFLHYVVTVLWIHLSDEFVIASVRYACPSASLVFFASYKLHLASPRRHAQSERLISNDGSINAATGRNGRRTRRSSRWWLVSPYRTLHAPACSSWKHKVVCVVGNRELTTAFISNLNSNWKSDSQIMRNRLLYHRWLCWRYACALECVHSTWSSWPSIAGCRCSSMVEAVCRWKWVRTRGLQ